MTTTTTTRTSNNHERYQTAINGDNESTMRLLEDRRPSSRGITVEYLPEEIAALNEEESSSPDLSLYLKDDTIVDLSILSNGLPEEAPEAAPPVEQPRTTTTRRREQQLLRTELYPPLDMVDNVPELLVSDIMEQTRIQHNHHHHHHNQHRRPPPQRHPSVVRRTKERGVSRNHSGLGAEHRRPFLPFHSTTGSSSSSSSTNSHHHHHHSDPFNDLPPGAYECTPGSYYDQADYMRPLREKEETLYRESRARPEEHQQGFQQHQHHHQDNYNDYNNYSNNDDLAAPTMIELEIEPGVKSVLRGSKETWNAVQRGYTTDACCFGCMAPLLCIADAEYVLCPDCKTISPASSCNSISGGMMTGGGDSKHAAPKCNGLYPSDQVFRGGIGLGLRADQHDFAPPTSQYSY